MLKRSIKTFILCFVLSIMCTLGVNAASLESIVEPGDIIIGNTVFRSDDWISASRSSKAGALYAMNTGETEVRVFYYDDFEDWYEYNDTTSKYELITEPTLSELGDIIDIYYDNNEPLVNTYEAYVERGYDEELGEEYIKDFNMVFEFFDYLPQLGEIMVDDPEVELDYTNQTITCPYDKTFEFQVVRNNEGQDYIGYCGLEEFGFIEADEAEIESLQVERIEVGNLQNENQSKISFENRDYQNILKIHDKLSDVSINPYNGDYGFEGRYVALDIKFIENNNCYSYSLTKNGFASDVVYHYACVDQHTMRLYLEADNYNNYYHSFTLLDNMFSTFEQIYFQIEALPRPEIVLNNVDIVDSSFYKNNGLIASIERTTETIDGEEQKYLIVDTIGDFEETYEYNGIPGKWIALDFMLNDDIDYDDYFIYNNLGCDVYDVLEDRIRFYFDMNQLDDEREIGIGLEGALNNLRYKIRFNNLTFGKAYKVESEEIINNNLVQTIEVVKDTFEGTEKNYILVNSVGNFEEFLLDESVTGKWVAIDFVLEGDFDPEKMLIHNGYGSDIYDVLEDRIRFYFDMENTQDRDIRIKYRSNSTDGDIECKVIFNNYQEDKAIEDYYNLFDGVYTIYSRDNDLLIEKANLQMADYTNYFVHDGKLYLKEANVLFKDNEGLKKVRYDSENDNYFTVPVEMQLVITNGVDTPIWTSAPDNIAGALYDNVLYLLEEYEEYGMHVEIHKFFKEDRILTEDEQAEFDKLDTLINEGKVEIIDISHRVYEH